MSTETEIREFLTTRRAKLTPERVGLPTFGRQRRVAGLRREEVALLAGISVEYYTRLERGNARGVSDSVLESIADALRLNEAERDHLAHLARRVVRNSLISVSVLIAGQPYASVEHDGRYCQYP